MSFFDSTKPLGLPDGSIRAIIALMFSGVTLYLWATSGAPDVALVGITTAIVGNYFGYRGGETASAFVAPQPVSRPYIPGEDEGDR